MFKKGFTLAEVLITLGIIGIIAAMTLPVMNSNVSKAQVGPKLSKFVNTWESGVNAYLMSSDDAILSYEGFEQQLDVLKNYISWSTPAASNFKSGNKAVYNITDASGTTIISGDKINAEGETKYGRITKDGMLLIFDSNEKITYANAPAPYSEFIAKVYVDINGFKEPNKLAQDIFKFYIDKSGLLVAPGSFMYKKITSSAVACSDSGNTLQNEACTGKIQDNNWKFD